MTVVGTIKRIEDLKQISEKFKSQDLIVTTEEEYSQTLSIQFAQDKTELLKNFAPGQKVKIEIKLRGKEVIKDDKPPMVFNTLSAWKIDRAI
jgi:translation initiation factor IF-3